MEELKDKIRNFLNKHNSLNLAYSDNDGIGACGLWYVSDYSLSLYYLSEKNTRHGRALLNGGNIAFTIHKDDQPWKEITGIQGRGYAKIFHDPTIWELYVEKFPFVNNQITNLQNSLGKAKFWKITPHWIRLIDNSVAFGFKEELQLK